MAYGLTDAGAYAEKIGLTDLGRRVVAPTSEGDDLIAMREAVVKPRVTQEFLRKYSGSKWPRDDIGRNVLETMGVPAEQAERALELIHTDAENENRRVFITHGKHHKIVDQIKKLLVFGDFEAVISEENQTTAKPVPDKVMDDMRSCSAGLVHVGAETTVIDAEGTEHLMLNPNVLIERSEVIWRRPMARGWHGRCADQFEERSQRRR